MPKSAVANVKDSSPSNVTFQTTYHLLSLTDMGAGLAVITPEWDGMALVLTKEDVRKLEALCKTVTARP
jgi:hypothetical protein